ncbi:MAG: Stp1/IreP family PP2C-type Ser/Thr phosphatase [Ruminococcus sp.]|nr:Stp1/IreP family PP2C-type Ser/Thr phosphatase [Ruminococcus sp.]MBQ7008736.1 Stp1/IreP family PP2C-type Ser/Thr phosphatase [Ruminococcus sp.]MBR4022823.1 Stp1/IreP family PP2C-type Ser/Thr phosphatase [Ruminococcus sp.]
MRYTALTDIGLKREENQDTVKCKEFGENILAVVCDGMGGERAGREASEIAIDEVIERFSEGYSDDLEDEEIRKLLISSISAANSVIYTKARFDYKNFGMGTTCVAAFVNKSSAYIANVGDSRCYVITEEGLCQITTDHNVAALLYEQGKISEDELVNHPQKNMLLRAVGVDKTVQVDTFILDYDDKISLLLCSDGLSGYSSNEEIFEIIIDTPFETVANELVKLAYSKGGRDNITVALITD